MAPISLKAHFDGDAIRLDEPYELPRDAKLLVVVLPPMANHDALANWSDLSAAGLARAYGANEPDYSAADVIP